MQNDSDLYRACLFSASSKTTNDSMLKVSVVEMETKASVGN